MARIRNGFSPARPGLRRRLRPSRPHWPGILRSKWLLLYVVVLPAGIAGIVVLALVLREDPPDTSGAAFEDFPLEFSLLLEFRPGPGDVPASAEQVPGAHAFLTGVWLAGERDPQFKPWRRYVVNEDLVLSYAWVERDGPYTSVSMYPSFDEEAARAAFDAIRTAELEQFVPFLTLSEELRELEWLPDPAIGDESVAFRIVLGNPPDPAGRLPTRVVQTEAIWVRVGGSIFFAARNTGVGDLEAATVPEISPDPIDITLLAGSIAARVEAFDPASVDVDSLDLEALALALQFVQETGVEEPAAGP